MPGLPAKLLVSRRKVVVTLSGSVQVAPLSSYHISQFCELFGPYPEETHEVWHPCGKLM